MREFEKQMRAFEKMIDRFVVKFHHIAADGAFVLTERTDVIEKGASGSRRGCAARSK